MTYVEKVGESVLPRTFYFIKGAGNMSVNSDWGWVSRKALMLLVMIIFLPIAESGKRKLVSDGHRSLLYTKFNSINSKQSEKRNSLG
jgi:hypothetical protein